MNAKFINSRATTIQRCIDRLEEIHPRSVNEYPSSHDREDLLLINLIRLAEACIDIAKHVAKLTGHASLRDAHSSFRSAAEDLDISLKEAEALAKMVGFRNLAVHDYTKIESSIVEDIVENHLALPLKFSINAKAFVKQNRQRSE